jgi:hypothetical protein
VHDDGESLIQVGRLIDLLHNVLQGVKHQKISSGPYDDVNRTGIELFEDLPQYLEQINQQPGDGMQPPIEAAFREHPGNVSGLVCPNSFRARSRFPPKYKAAIIAVVITSASLILHCGSSL